jgi:glycosyltransferase involved in cell wall biosynthesis
MRLRRPDGLVVPEDRGPLRVAFLSTSLPVGGAETLLVNLLRRLDRGVVAPELVCLKELGPLGAQMVGELPTFHHLINGKYDARVVWRLVRLFRQRRLDAVVTVGAGDKMFWGRIAATLAGVPVVCSALHSTGWPDGVGRLNRWLTPWTDAFIAVALAHARHLVEGERFPAEKVKVIPNGVDTERFNADAARRRGLRLQLGWEDECPLVGIVAALRPEKNHELFLDVAQRVQELVPECRFVIVGDGPRRTMLEKRADDLRLGSTVHFLGNRSDTFSILSALDVFLLTSHNEASPVSILEALACQVPVVATDVGSVHESVVPDVTGLLAPAGDADRLTQAVWRLLVNPVLRATLGRAGRQLVIDRASLDQMVSGYERLLVELYRAKCRPPWSPGLRRRGLQPDRDAIDLG